MKSKKMFFSVLVAVFSILLFSPAYAEPQNPTNGYTSTQKLTGQQSQPKQKTTNKRIANNSNSPKTGDDSNIEFIVTICIVSFIMILIYAISCLINKFKNKDK